MRRLCFGAVFSIFEFVKPADIKTQLELLFNISENCLCIDLELWGKAVNEVNRVSEWGAGQQNIPGNVKSAAQDIDDLSKIIENTRKFLFNRSIIDSNKLFIKNALKNILFEDKHIHLDAVLFKNHTTNFTKRDLLTQDYSAEKLFVVLMIYALAQAGNEYYKGIKKADNPIKVKHESDEALVFKVEDLLETKEYPRFSTVEETKKLLKLGEKLHELLRNLKSRAELVSKIRCRDILSEIKKTLPNDCKIDEQSFDSIYSSIIDFYKSNDEVSYCGIVIGIYIKEMYYCEHFPKIYCETELIQDISELPQNIVLNPEKLQSQIQEIGHLDIENIQEQIANYLVNQYSEKTQLTSAVENAEHIYGIIDFLSQNCQTLSDAKRTLSILIKESQAVSNYYSKNILEKFNATMNDLLEDQYSKYIKYRVWPFAIWEDVELFEIICMDNIEIIARSSANRQEALKTAEQSINLFKILNAERDIQILSRVAYEFAAASDEEYDMLKKQLED